MKIGFFPSRQERCQFSESLGIDTMKKIEMMCYWVGFWTFGFLTVPSNSMAYIDPGTGSYILQLILGVLLGIVFAVKSFWYRIRSFFYSLLSKKDKD